MAAITTNVSGVTGLKCKGDDGVCRKVTWRYFYVNCPRINFLCNPYSGAYVPAITVCRQQLWTATSTEACS
jgi:hypothetical protein